MVEQFRSATGPNKIALPTNDSDLEEKWVVLCCIKLTPAAVSFHLLSSTVYVYRLDTEEEMIIKTYDESQVSTKCVIECSIRLF